MVPTVIDPKFGRGIPAADFNPRELPDAGPPCPAPSPEGDRGPMGGLAIAHRINPGPAPEPASVPPPVVDTFIEAVPNTVFFQVGLKLAQPMHRSELDALQSEGRAAADALEQRVRGAADEYKAGSEDYAKLAKLRADMARLEGERDKLRREVDAAKGRIATALLGEEDLYERELQAARLAVRLEAVEKRLAGLPEQIRSAEESARAGLVDHLRGVVAMVKGEAAAEHDAAKREFVGALRKHYKRLALAVFMDMRADTLSAESFA